jgi:hypothetical protein
LASAILSLVATCAGPTQPAGNATGGSVGSGGAERSGGSTGTALAAGGAGGANGGGGSGGSADPAGGAPGTGGWSSTGGSISAGGTQGNGGALGNGGSSSDAATTNDSALVTSGSYALGAPNQMINQFWITGCQSGVATSPGGGVCAQGQNACEGTKQGAQVNFLCPRFMLFSDEMAQAAIDDGNAGLNYAVVGHDVETGGIDGSQTNSCCQCYQLVFYLPEAEAQVNGGGKSAIPIPPPLVVQAFNTSAGGGKNFDVYMAAGGFGAFDACAPSAGMTSASGKYLYTDFPPDGEPGAGGLNAATQVAGCKGQYDLVNTASLSSTACQSNVVTACAKIEANSQAVTDESVRSCVKSNDPNTYYHINWQIYAKRVECPIHLTEVTGCKLAPQGLPAVNTAVLTPDQAAGDSSFKSGYTTTTMQDCCMPTCAWQSNVSGNGAKVIGQYNSFYSCDQSGTPVTN